MFQQLFLSLYHRSTWATWENKGKEMWDAHLNNQFHKQENLKLELGKGEQKNVQVEWQKREKKVKFSFFNEFVSGCAPLGCRGGLLLLQTAGLFSSCGSQAPLAPERGLQGLQPPVILARGLSCSTVCGIFPGQGSNLCSLHQQADSYPQSHQGSLIVNFLYP